jgi:hypothetical protein
MILTLLALGFMVSPAVSSLEF